MVKLLNDFGMGNEMNLKYHLIISILNFDIIIQFLLCEVFALYYWFYLLRLTLILSYHAFYCQAIIQMTSHILNSAMMEVCF